jgi:uncharacterized peroxidase-related enzyme
MPFFGFLDDNSGVGDIMVHDPERYLPLGTFTQDLLRGPSVFTVAERELIAAYVSGLNQCQFCHGAHAAVAADLGVDKSLFAALLDDVDRAPVADKLKPVLRYVKTLTLAPSRLTQADADAVFAAGWDEQALGDAVAICALFNLYNRLVEGHGIKGNAAYFERLKGFIAKGGYETRTRQALEAKRRQSA